MVASNNLSQGMVIELEGKLFRVESSVKVNVPKGTPFIKTQLFELETGKVSEKNFKLNQILKELNLKDRHLEFLYLEGKDYLFLDIDELENMLVSPEIVGEAANYLKEGGAVLAKMHNDEVYAIELPPFLELMVARTEDIPAKEGGSNGEKKAILETGAAVTVPLFIEAGDILKIDTKNHEYIQRV
ncbi:MAG: elongation factor P [Chlamydiales bacterium]